jgi:hypothetical protein
METRRRLKVLAIGAGLLLVLALIIVVVGYLLAPHFYLTRTIFWGESDYRDSEKDLVIVRLGKEEGEQGYDYWIYLFEELTTRLDTSSVKGSG